MQGGESGAAERRACRAAMRVKSSVTRKRGSPRQMAARLSDLSDAEIARLDWYYRTELRPGAFTRGRQYANVLATRALMQRVDWAGMAVLDIGAQEGANAILAERAGAIVTSYDRLDLSDRIALVKEAYRARFNYVCGLTFPDFVANHHRERAELFQGVIFSGVLYHTVEPTMFLHLVHSLLKPGGVLVLETVTALDRDATLLLNEPGRYQRTAVYYPSVGWLDFYLRLLGFRIIDMEYARVGANRLNRRLLRSLAPLWRQVGIRSPWTWRRKSFLRLAVTAVLTGEPPPPGAEALARVMKRELQEHQPIRGEAPFDGLSRVKPAAYGPALSRDSTTPPMLKLFDAVVSRPPAPGKLVDCLLRLDDGFRR